MDLVYTLWYEESFDEAFKLLDTSEIAQSKDGSYEGLKEAIDSLAESEPWTLGKAKKTKAPNIGPTDPPESDEEGKESESEKAKRYFGPGVEQGGFFEKRKGGVVLPSSE